MQSKSLIGWALGTLLTCLGLWGCGQPEEKNFGSIAHRNIPFGPRGDEILPGPPTPLSKLLTARLIDGAPIRHFLPVRRFVKLEMREQAVIGSIQKLAYLAPYFYILDGSQAAVFLYRDDGTFVRRVGSKGEGPGEYESPEGLRIIWGDHLAVADRGDILVYDREGNFKKMFRVKQDNMRVVVNQNFIWDSPQRLYVGNFPTLNMATPNHAIIDVEGDLFKISGGFGYRFATVEAMALQNRAIRWSYDCFERIGDRIWIGTPYTGVMEIYDMEGRLLGQVQRQHPDQLTPEDFEGIDLGSDREMQNLFGRPRNYKIFPVGNLVFSYIPSSGGMQLDVFDQQGNPLQQGIVETMPFSHAVASNGNQLIGVLSVFESHDDFEKILTKKELELLVQSGWDSTNYINDNPYLVIGELVE